MPVRKPLLLAIAAIVAGMLLVESVILFQPSGRGTATPDVVIGLVPVSYTHLTQTATTDEDGKATVYVKRGSYTLTAAHERFTESISQTTSVSSSRTVKMTGEILENVQVVVTNKYGAMLSGAVVSIGGKAATTGADGVASFSLRRDNYVIQVSCSGYTTTTKPITVTDSIRTQVQLE